MFLQVIKWSLLNQMLCQFFSKKRARNHVSFIHSLLCLYKIYSNQYENLSLLSISYFFNDIIYIVFNYSKSEKIYLYHHLICILFLLEFNQLNLYELYYIYGVGELSNIFTYIVYDMLKSDTSQLIVNKVKYIQILWYIFFRVICFTYFIYSKSDAYFQLKIHSQIGGLLIYCMGLVWSYNQVRSLV